MSADNAKALAAKVLSDENLAKQLNEAKNEQEFKEIVGKLGYSDIDAKEFSDAFKEQKNNLSDDQLDQAAGGLSIVGVDYAFVVVQTVS